MTSNGCRKQKSKSCTNKERSSHLLFNDDYHERFDCNHDDLMIITSIAYNYAIKNILVDQRSLTNILYNATTTSMNIQKVV